MGWITIGVQAESHTIDVALRTQEAAKALPSPRPGSHAPDTNGIPEKPEDKELRIQRLSSTQSEPRTPRRDKTTSTTDFQEGFIVLDDGNGLNPQPNSTATSGVLAPYSHFLNVRGDEGERGPIFNYARLFTWSHLTNNVMKALATKVAKIRAEELCQDDLPDHLEGHAADVPDMWTRVLEGSSKHTERYCGLDQNPLFAYPEWKEIPLEMWKAIFVAAFWAMFVQWGTTGSACKFLLVRGVMGSS